MMPALLTRMSTRPNRSTAASTSASAPAAVATSLVSAIAAPPASTISAATVDAGPASAPVPSMDPPRSFTTTLGAPVGEQPGVGPADAAPGAGDDRDPPLEAVARSMHRPSSRPPLYRPVTILLAPNLDAGALVSAVLYSSADHVGVITLNRPEARNAVDRDLALGLEAAVDRIEDDPDVWVGVLGANTADQARPVFCAGADLKVIRETGSAATLDTERGGFAGFVYRERTKPIVVAVDGLATAGGLEIVLAADIVVATTRSAFGLAEVRRNLIAAAGGLFRLPRDRPGTCDGRHPHRRADRRAPRVRPRAGEPPGRTGSSARQRRFGSRSRSSPPLRLRCGPAAAWSSPRRPSPTPRSARVSRTLLDELLESDDANEGLAAFAEKRTPQWQGR